ncbi:MAG TPA: PadR family transcriptional regulator [Acidimicrobiia bacterium]
MPHKPQLTLREHVLLALLCERPAHGWAIARELAPGGAIGRIWTVSRPLAYRAMDDLAEHKLIRATGTEQGDGPRRTIYAATARGRREHEHWLTTPIEHLRDVRTELLLKLVFGERERRNPRSLLRAQKQAFQPIFVALEKAAAAPGADVVDHWRLESAAAVQRFLDTAGGR